MNLFSIGIYAIVTAGLLWIPLFNVLHAEACMVIAALAFFVAGTDAISMFQYGRPRVWSVVAREWSYLLTPFLIYLFARLWLPGCDFLAGVKFYLLFPVITVVFAVSLAFLLTAFRLKRTRLWLVMIGIGLITLPVLYDLGFHPQFYTYNHVFGGVLGPIYDLELANRQGLYWFRVLTLLWSAFAILAGYGLREPVRGARAGVTLIAVSIGLVYVLAGRLGFNTTYARLADDLGSELQTPHFVIHYDSSSVSSVDARHLAADHEFRYRQLVERLGIEPELPVHSYLYPSAWIRAELTGAGFTNIAPVWLGRPQVHVLLDTYDRSFTHELAHVFSREFGIPVLNTSPWVGLVEGFAVAMEPPDGLPPPDDQVAAILKSPTRAGVYGRRSLAEDITATLSPTGFWTGRGAVSYTTMGSFVGYLIEEFGVEKFTRVYGLRGFDSVYGRPVRSIAAEWERSLLDREVEAGVLDLAARRFSIPSIFERHCPHDFPDSYYALRRGRVELAEDDTTGALAWFRKGVEESPQFNQTLEEWATLKLALGGYEEVVRVLGRAWSSERAFSPILTVRLADALALSGRGEQARTAYESVLDTLSEYARDLRALLRLRLLAGGRPEIIREIVTGGDPERKSDSLLAIADTTGAAPVFAALLAAEADEYAAAADILKESVGTLAEAAAGERFWAWLAGFSFRSGRFFDAERFRRLAVEEARRVGDDYQIMRLEDFRQRIEWAVEVGLQ